MARREPTWLGLSPPWATARTRVLWSIPAVFILFFWWAVVTAADVSIFPVHWSQGTIIRSAWSALRSGHPSGLIPCMIVACCWVLVLVPWRDRAHNFWAAIASCVIPVACSLSIGLCGGPLGLLPAVYMMAYGADGEDLEDFGLAAGASLWLWFMLPVVVLSIKANRTPKPGVCGVCGYSLQGLPSDVCPECGTRRAQDEDAKAEIEERVPRS